FRDVADFLAELDRIAPVVLILGNHDTNLSTPGALDLLSPVVENSKSLERLVFWRSSGTYAAHGAAWTVISPDGPVPSPGQSEAAVLGRGGILRQPRPAEHRRALLAPRLPGVGHRARRAPAAPHRAAAPAGGRRPQRPRVPGRRGAGGRRAAPAARGPRPAIF